LADGGFFFEEGVASDLAQTRQEVLIAFYDGDQDGLPRTTYVLRSRYAGEPDAFAWVIPVPATPTDIVAHETGALFDSLNESTRPRFMVQFFPSVEWGTRLSCGCLAEDLGQGPRETGLVVEEARGTAGIFEWVALTSTGGQALLDWLNANRFAVPLQAAEILDRYIQQNMHFLAVRVNEPQTFNEGDGTIEIPPLQFTCQTSRHYYPMVISQISAADETEVLIYVLADHRAEAANLPNGLVDPNMVVYDPNSPSLSNYESVFGQALAELGEPALITEYAQPTGYNWNEMAWPTPPPDEVLALSFLTRVRTVISREAMTVDFEFQDATDDERVYPTFWLDSSQYASAASLAAEPLTALLLYGAFCGVMRRRWVNNRDSIAR
jgi:hypothetical protein